LELEFGRARRGEEPRRGGGEFWLGGLEGGDSFRRGRDGPGGRQKDITNIALTLEGAHELIAPPGARKEEPGKAEKRRNIFGTNGKNTDRHAAEQARGKQLF